jgi:hypothetical protein
MTQKILDLSEKDLEKIIRDNPIRYRPWTEKELMIYRKLHGKVPAKKIAEILGRNLNSVYNRNR